MRGAETSRKDELNAKITQAKHQVKSAAKKGGQKLAPLFRPCFKLVEPIESNNSFVLGYN